MSIIYMALYVENSDGTYLLDDNGDKIEYTIDYHSDEDIIDEAQLLINVDGHADTDRNIVAKPATNDNHVVIKSQVGDIVRDSFLDLWVSEYLIMYSSCTYQMDRADGSNVKMTSARKVEKLFDKSNEESDATQSDLSKRPLLCTKAEKHNGRYYLKFDGTQKMVSQVDLNNDAVNVFIVYRMTSRNSQNFWTNGLFGHDHGRFDKSSLI